MDIMKFVEIAKRQDRRNVFERYEGNIESIPLEFRPFFRKCNPVDVEVMMNGAFIKFYSVEKLDSLHLDYDLDKGDFIFSTCNSDPIFINTSGVFIGCHGVGETTSERMAESIDVFFELIDE